MLLVIPVMRSRSKRIILGTVLLVPVALAALWSLWPSDEDRIRVRFEELSALVSKTEDASPLSDALVMNEFPELFCEEVVLGTGSAKRLSGKYTGQELARRYGRIRILAKRLELRFEDLEFLSVDKDEARVKAKVIVSGTDKKGNTRGEAFSAEVLLRKPQGEWRFGRFTYLGSSA